MFENDRDELFFFDPPGFRSLDIRVPLFLSFSSDALLLRSLLLMMLFELFCSSLYVKVVAALLMEYCFSSRLRVWKKQIFTLKKIVCRATPQMRRENVNFTYLCTYILKITAELLHYIPR